MEQNKRIVCTDGEWLKYGTNRLDQTHDNHLAEQVHAGNHCAGQAHAGSH